MEIKIELIIIFRLVVEALAQDQLMVQVVFQGVVTMVLEVSQALIANMRLKDCRR